MYKKAAILLITSLVLFSMAGCSDAKSAEKSSSTPPPQISQSPSSVPESNISGSDGALDILDDIEEENNIFDVTITIPADYMEEGATQEELDKEAKEKGYKSVTLNEDGSATFIMTKKQHRELMDDVSSSLMEALDEMLTSGDYPNIASIEPNNDFTDFKVTVKEDELGLATSMSVLTYATCGAMYHTFNGTQPEDIHAPFISASTGQVIKEWNLSDMAA